MAAPEIPDNPLAFFRGLAIALAITGVVTLATVAAVFVS